MNLQYTKLVAPVNGIVMKNVEVGMNVQPGQQLFTIVPLDDVWVTANFKETQLKNMRPGQAAKIQVDAYGRDYKGHVDSIAGSSGARISLLPPENATGNYVKVVQRVPVKIVLDAGREQRSLACVRGCRSNPRLREVSAGATIAAPREDSGGRAVNPWIIALTVTLATFMEVLDTSVANVALPHIAGSLSAGTDESTWVLTSYLVSNAIILPLSGWLSALIGRKRFYMSCVALFTISSFLCGFAPKLGMLIFFRVLQGVGGGGLAAERASDPGRHVSPRQARHGVRRVRHGRGAGAGHRPDTRRLDHRQFQLALDFLHQHSGRHSFADAHEPADLRIRRT